MKKIFNKEFKIGIFVILAILILIFGIDYLKGINLFNPANFYYANYENVQGLEVASPVTCNGYKIGQVREISFDYDHPGKVKVQLALNKEVKLPENSKALIASTLLSGAYIDIKIGDSKKMLPIGGEIQPATTPDLMATVSNDIMPAVNDMLPKINAIMDNLDTVTTNLALISSDPALSASIKRLNGITGNINSMTDNFNTISFGLRGQVPSVMNNVSRITYGLDTVAANLGALSAQLRSLPLNATMDNVNQITENLTRFSNQLNDQKSSLGMLMNDPELYNRLNNVAADVDSLIVDIKKNPKRYISIKLL
ncbi:MAG: MlaD family protein [Muribaculaceae bacterium]|nr:MlaD family protein [Muribaculaceae bacterium]